MPEMHNVASRILDKLADGILSDTGCLWVVKSELIQKLQLSILRLQEILPEVPVEEHQRYFPALKELKDVFNEVDDMLNDIAAVKSGKQKLTWGSNIGRMVRLFCSSSNPLVFHRTIAFKIRAIMRKLDGLEADFRRFHDTSASVIVDPSLERLDRETTSYVNPSEIIGREKDKEKIIQILTQPTTEELRVIPIVGMSGLGKTALAQLVFNDEKVLNMQFELRLWACVAETTSLKELAIEILKSLSPDSDFHAIPSLADEISKSLLGKSYLLVLDNVCGIGRDTWFSLLRFFMKMGANQSRIIVTTRRNDIGEMMGTVPPFRLEGLPFQDSMSLFLSIFSSEVPDEELVKVFVTKCGGVPSAVKKMATMLSCRTIEEWKSITDCEIWEMPKPIRDQILSFLESSYDRMPYHLKQCLKYCSFFPKDYEFGNFELIQFWEAFGLIFLDSKDDNKAVGMDYIKGLWSFSMLKECKGEAAFCLKYKMPQLIHDLALGFQQSEFAMVKPSTQVINNRVRHLLIVSSELSRQHALRLLDGNMGSIQTLIFVGKVEQFLVESFIRRWQLLRVLILRKSGLREVPRGAEGLKTLKYLDLTGNEGVKEIPNFICMRQSLETLILEGCTGVVQLPRDIKNLSNLNMLSITTKQSFLAENGVGRLSSLRYLSIIRCPNLKYLPQGIHLLKSLRTLIIRDCDSLTSLPRSMKYLIALETLIIANCPKLRLNREMEAEEHLNPIGLSLHRCCLTSLPLLSDLPQWLVRKSAKTLKSLHIEDCQSLELIPYWLTEELTSLEEVEILNCKNLSHRQGIEPFTTLEKIKIEGCPNLTQQSPISTQSGSPSQIPKSSIGGNSHMEKGKGKISM